MHQRFGFVCLVSAALWIGACDSQAPLQQVWSPDAQSASTRAEDSTALEVGPASTLERTEHAREVWGTARKVETVVGVAGVRLWQAGCEPGVVTDTDGRFRLLIDPTGLQRLQCEIDGDRFAYFADGEIVPDHSFGHTAIDASVDEFDVEIVGRRADTLTLRVLNERTDAPLFGRTVRVVGLRPSNPEHPARALNGVTDMDGIVRIQGVPLGPVEVSVPPHRPGLVVHRGASDRPTDVLLEEPRSIEFRLIGVAVDELCAWKIVIAEDDGRAIEDLLEIAYGRGARAEVSPSLLAERLMLEERDWLLLAIDGTFCGASRGGPTRLESGVVQIDVEPTAALVISTTAARTDAISPALRDSAARLSATDRLVLEREGRDSRVAEPFRYFSHAITPQFDPGTPILLARRLEAGKWLPPGVYQVDLVSPYLRSAAARVELRASRIEHLTLHASRRDDTARVDVQIRSNSGSASTDFPTLIAAEGDLRQRTYQPRDLETFAFGSTLLSYTQRSDAALGVWGLELSLAQPELLTFSAEQAGTLTERREPVRDGVVRVQLEWTPEPDAAAPR
jgi:hypothetical protein